MSVVLKSLSFEGLKGALAHVRGDSRDAPSKSSGLPTPSITSESALRERQPFRARQVFRWIHARGAISFDEMTDLSRDFRNRLAASGATVGSVQVAKVALSVDGTRKLAIRLHDGAEVESVIIPERGRQTLCISTQAGCALGCAFCFTGVLGWRRQMEPYEIVDQLYRANALLAVGSSSPNGAERISHIVLMGMGEPLANYDATLTALRLFTHPDGAAISPRRITVSTVGLVPELLRLGDAIPVNLAVSLHAPNDAIRNAIMPINRTYNLDRLLAACRAFPLRTRRCITFEYVLLADLNDRPSHARELARRLHGIRCKVNLIPFNPFPGAAFNRPNDAAIDAFRASLVDRGVTATVRRSRGRDIFAACGQLANFQSGAVESAPLLTLGTLAPKLSTGF